MFLLLHNKSFCKEWNVFIIEFLMLRLLVFLRVKRTLWHTLIYRFSFCVVGTVLNHTIVLHQCKALLHRTWATRKCEEISPRTIVLLLQFGLMTIIDDVGQGFINLRKIHQPFWFWWHMEVCHKCGTSRHSSYGASWSIS